MKYKRKRYSHFDNRNVTANVEDPNFVLHHSFYPFLYFQIKQNRYKPHKEKKAEQHEPKVRDIYYASHTDRCVYQYYAELLNERYNKYCDLHNFGDNAVAYRNNLKGKCNIHFAADAIKFIKAQEKCLVIVGDFTSFFDNLDHAYLKDCIQKVLGVDRLAKDWFKIYRNICNYSHIEIKDILDYNRSKNDPALPVTRKQLNNQEIIFPISEIRKNHREWIKSNDKTYGIPQGSSISGVFANVYMIEFDELLCDFCKRNNGFYRRYSDDFILVLPLISDANIAEIIHQVFDIQKTIDAKGKLDLKAEKTHCSVFSNCCINEIDVNGQVIKSKDCTIDFLGFSFNGQEVDIRNKTKSKNNNKIKHKAQRLFQLNGKTKKSGENIIVSEKGVYDTFGKTYRIDPQTGKRKSTYKSYLKRCVKVFKGEKRIVSQFKYRKRNIDKLITSAYKAVSMKNK